MASYQSPDYMNARRRVQGPGVMPSQVTADPNGRRALQSNQLLAPRAQVAGQTGLRAPQDPALRERVRRTLFQGGPAAGMGSASAAPTPAATAGAQQLPPARQEELRAHLRAAFLAQHNPSVGALPVGAHGMATQTTGDPDTSSQLEREPSVEHPDRGRNTRDSGVGAGPATGNDPFDNFLRMMYSRNTGRGTSAAAMRRSMMQMQGGIAYQYLPQLQQSIADLQAQSDPRNLSTAYAKDFENVHDQFDVGQGRLDRALAERGLTDSSYGAAAQGAFSAGQAQATSNLQNQLTQEARSRGDLARQIIQQLVTGNMTGASDIVNRIRAEKLQGRQMQGGSWMDQLLQLGVAGTEIAKNT